ncbi:hypothetical protein ACN6AT_37660 (plasmid) [Streptomyces sp. JL4002]|uniref:hypothetical protein n=1 Tax=Streptomyces sp. JL4002 TaxID=3404781 RepID=UPI003B28DA0D
MPTLDELPEGAVRLFVEEIFFHYREAKRPSLREIQADLAEPEMLAGTASRETIRRTLRGENVPTRWTTVHAVLTALCGRSGIEPDSMRYADAEHFPHTTYEDALHQLWDDAMEGTSNPDRNLRRPLTRDWWLIHYGSSQP